MLFMPGNDERKLAKLGDLDVASFVLDLEDAVVEAEKARARELAAAAVARAERRVYVRVNGLRTPHLLADVLAVVRPGLCGLLVPKVESAEDLRLVDWLVGQAERANGVAPGTIALLATLESARGLLAAEAIAHASPRLDCLCFGAGDLSTDLGAPLDATPPPAETQALAIALKARLVLASSAAGLAPPHDGVHLDFRDDDGLRAAVAASRALGFGGRHAIHPRQMPIIEAGFAPDAGELARASRIAEAYRAAEQRGEGAILVDGEFVDQAIAIRAERLLAR